jgi:hypothetical protein
MTLSIKTSTRNGFLDKITTDIGASGLLRIYDGTPPASVNDALSGNTLLAELALSATFAPGASSGLLVANAITSDSSANATGTATFFRLTTSGGTAIVQGSVGTVSGDCIINTISIVSGATVSALSLQFQAPNA